MITMPRETREDRRYRLEDLLASIASEDWPTAVRAVEQLAAILDRLMERVEELEARHREEEE